MTSLHISRKHYIDINTIRYIEGAEGPYSKVFSTSEPAAVLSRNLKRLQTELPAFWRTHKRYLVNPDYVVRLHRDFVVLTTGENIPVSRRKWNKIALAMRNREFDKQQFINNQ